MVISTEVKQGGRETPQFEEQVPRATGIWVLGTSAFASIWMWAAFIRGHGHSRVVQLALMAGVFMLLAIAARMLGGILRRRLRLSPGASATALAYCYSAWLLPAAFLPEYLLGGRPLPARTFFLLACCLLLLAAFLVIAIRRGSAGPGGVRWNIRPAAAVAAVCVVYFALAGYGSIRKLYAFGYVGQDVAYFTQTLYTTLHGHLFYSNMYHDLLYSKPVSSDFAGHNQLVLALFLPFYALHQSAATLLLLRNAMIVLCAWPVYLIARRALSPGLSAAASIAFLLVPAVAYQNIYDFAPLSVAAFPLLFAIYFFLEGRFRPFLIAIFFTQIVREDLVFAVFGLGLLALWQRRAARWVAVPCGFAVLWAVLSWKIVFPYFLQGATSAVASCFAYLGNTPIEMMRQIPHHARALLSRSNLIYTKQMADSFGGVLFLGSPAWALSLPFLAINLLGQEGGCNTAMVYRHYSLIPAAFLFASFLMSVEKVTGYMKARGRDPYLAQAGMVLFVLAAAITSLVFVTGRPQAEDLRSRPWHDEARAVVAMVPEGASVAAPRYLLPSLANRGQLYQSLRLLEYHHPDVEFVILDKDWNRMAATEQWRSNYLALENILARHREYSRIYDSPGYAVYRRCEGCAVDLKLWASEGSAHD